MRPLLPMSRLPTMSDMQRVRQEYTDRLLDGFSLPLISVFDRGDRAAFDTLCVEIREAWAGNILYLKHFERFGSAEGYFVVDMPDAKTQHIFDRLRSLCDCFERCDVCLHLPQDKQN